MLTTFNRLPESFQGIVFIACGAIIVLYALGLIKTGINLLVIGSGAYLIVDGAMKMGIFKKLQRH